MSSTHLNFSTGDESDEFFWRQVQELPGQVHHLRKPVSTNWTIADALAAGETAGITVTRLFTGYFKDNNMVVAARLEAGPRYSCLMLLKWHGDRDYISGEFVSLSEDDITWYGEAVLGGAPEPPEKEPEADDGIFIDFTFMGTNQPQVITREITAPEWAEISGNYPVSVRGILEDLVKGDLETRAGRIAVLHGPAGTGKSTFLRCLAREWADQADFSYIVDAEQFFTDSHYMMRVLLGENNGSFIPDDDDGEEESWHVILLEDAEEFITPGAKGIVGQALARLLNLGDGMLGQGLKVLFIFTTNVKVEHLHPAVVRDGRCFLQAEIPAFTASEAGGWLRDHGTDTAVSGVKTLSELYRILRDGGSGGETAGVYDSGAYL